MIDVASGTRCSIWAIGTASSEPSAVRNFSVRSRSLVDTEMPVNTRPSARFTA